VIARYTRLLALLAGLSSGQDAADSRRATDVAAIEELHKLDAAAEKKGDLAALAELWADDAVALPPAEPPAIGIDAIREWLAKSHPLAQDKPDEALRYAQQAMEIAPDNATVQDTVGWIWAKGRPRPWIGRWKRRCLPAGFTIC
jgi:hypothetical protein